MNKWILFEMQLQYQFEILQQGWIFLNAIFNVLSFQCFVFFRSLRSRLAIKFNFMRVIKKRCVLERRLGQTGWPTGFDEKIGEFWLVNIFFRPSSISVINFFRGFMSYCQQNIYRIIVSEVLVYRVRLRETYYHRFTQKSKNFYRPLLF